MKKRAVAAFVAIGGVVLLGTLSVAVGSAEPIELARRSKAFALAFNEESQAYGFHASRIGAATSGRRVYLFHGLRQNSSSWNRSPYSAIKAHLFKRGDELVLVDLPYTKAFMVAHGGASYCQQFSKWFESFDAGLPKANETVAIGASWGGWHSMILGNRVDRTIVFKPVTEPNALREFWWEDASSCTLSLPKKNIAIFSPSDPRVGDASAALRSANANVVISALPSHAITHRDVVQALVWLEDSPFATVTGEFERKEVNPVAGVAKQACGSRLVDKGFGELKIEETPCEEDAGQK